MPKLPLGGWLVENLRFTAFPTIEGTVRNPSWWETITKALPDETNVSTKLGAKTVGGTVEGLKLVLRAALDRIDWILMPADEDVQQAMINLESPSIGTLERAFQIFTPLMQTWLRLDDMPPVARFALGGIVFHPMPDKDTAYTHILEYIPVTLDPEASDLLFQINLPPMKSTTLPSLHFNRLSKWLVAHHALVGMPLNNPFSTSFHGRTPVSIRLELDINTVPTFPPPIPQENTEGILNGLCAGIRGRCRNC